MVELFIAGDPFYMGLLSCPLLAMIVIALNPNHQLLSGFGFASDNERRKKTIRSLGLFALIFGLFCQLLGLYGAMQAIRVWGEIKAHILFEGLGVSFINSGYGAIIFGISWVLSRLNLKPAKVTH